MAKVIFHIDLNAFFASAEVVKDSSLEGLPLVVGGLSKRSVVCAASYEARAFGVKSAMPLYEALSLCPTLIVKKGDHSYYQQVSKRFFDFIRTYTPCIQVASIDECYVDMSEVIKQYERPLDLAWELQRKLKSEIGLTCSIGIAPNKFLAKMASDMRKPMGITILRKSEVKTKLWPLPIEEMYGVGKKGSVLLKKHGIQTIEDFVKQEELVVRLMHKQGMQMIENAKGNGSDELVYNRSVKSISQSTTFPNDIESYEELVTILRKLTLTLIQKAKKDQVSGKLVSISLRTYDFKNKIRSQQLDTYTNDFNTIYELAQTLFDEHYDAIPLRHIGIGLGTLKSAKEEIKQLDLFSYEKQPYNVLDELNKQIESKTNKLVYASSVIKK